MIEYTSNYQWPRWLTRLFARKSEKVEAVELEIIPPEPRWKPATELERAVAAAMILAGKPITNAELARLMGCSPGEASKRITKMGAKVTKIRQGREVRISLPQYLH